MKTKLTLSIDNELVEFARKHAKANKSSISGMFSEYLLQNRIQIIKNDNPSIANMVGALKHYPINDSKQAIRAMYAQKYSG